LELADPNSAVIDWVLSAVNRIQPEPFAHILRLSTIALS
jgi:hypothetical protein